MFPVKSNCGKYGIVEEKPLLLEDKETLQIHCVVHMNENIFLLGAQQGMFSRKVSTKQPNSVVQIAGFRSVHQIQIATRYEIAVISTGSYKLLDTFIMTLWLWS